VTWCEIEACCRISFGRQVSFDVAEQPEYWSALPPTPGFLSISDGRNEEWLASKKKRVAPPAPRALVLRKSQA